ncbi:MAG TPA: homoserine kinase [Myxococcales bacterium]|nr:homoserine kinase [Myxococcales bacterium]
MLYATPWKNAFAPATIANLGPGFDILGLALDADLGLGDHCEVRLAPAGQLNLSITGDQGRLPTNPLQNVAGVAAMKVIEMAGANTGLDIRLHKGLPLGSGLGSSAASAASAAIATNEALGNPLTRQQLIEAGRAGEALACGVPHPDNVVPALLGGILLMVQDDEQLHLLQLPTPGRLSVVVVIPELEVKTADSRAVLPDLVPLSDAVFNAGRVGLLVGALEQDNLSLLKVALQDRLHQPYRSKLVSGYDEVRQAALDAGALGAGLSGSGPALFALAEEDATSCGEAMVQAFESLGISAGYAAGNVAAQF